MKRLLIVDDEWITADSLQMLVSERMPEAAVFKAYHGYEALAVMEEQRIDVILSDIHMPGMNGIELQEALLEKQPGCKLIFLTGYDDFEWAQQALRNGCFDYVLKTESDDAILSSIARAFESLEQDRHMRERLEAARISNKQAMDIIRRDLLDDLLSGIRDTEAHIEKQARELQLLLNPRRKLLLLVARVDEWEIGMSRSDRALLTYALGNIIEEYVRGFCVSLSTVYERTKLVFLLQPSSPEGEFPEGDWPQTVLSLHGLLDEIQRTARDLLKLSVSFAAGSAPVEWTDISREFDRLAVLLNFGLGLNKGMIVFGKEMPAELGGNVVEPARGEDIRKELLLLERDMGQRTDSAFQSLMDRLRGMSGTSLSEQERAEMKIRLAALLLGEINRSGLAERLHTIVDPSAMLQQAESAGWAEFIQYLTQVCEVIAREKDNTKQEGERNLVGDIRSFIQWNLHEDISLNRLAEHFRLSPAYLSSLYKQMSGESLSSYITETRLNKAKELLAQSSIRISDISKAVGFVSNNYFYRFFKNATSMTPHEYRDKYSRG